jgi:type VI secretion system ImpM family protein
MFGRKQLKEAEEIALPRVSITGAFGKLKLEPDFIHIDSNWREVRLLDETLQSVYSEMSRADRLEHFSGCGLLLTGGSDRQGLLAFVYPSEDKSGRFYPFVLFNRLSDTNYYLKPDATFAAGLSELATALKTTSNVLTLEEPRAEWLALLRSQPEHCTPMDARLAKRSAMALAERETFTNWLTELVGTDTDMRIDFITGLLALLSQFKQGRVHRAYHGIWLPLLTGDQRSNSIAFWLQLLTGIMTTQNWRPDIIWSIGDSNNRLFILNKPLTNSALQASTDPQQVVSSFIGWQDVDTTQTRHNIQFALKQWLAKPDTSLLDIAIEWYQLL